MDVYSLEDDGYEGLFLTQSSNEENKVEGIANFDVNSGDMFAENCENGTSNGRVLPIYSDISDDDMDVFCSSQAQQIMKEKGEWVSNV